MSLIDITATNTPAAPAHALICQLGQFFCNVCWMFSYRATRSYAIDSRSAVQSARLAFCAGRLVVGLEPNMLSLLLPTSCAQSHVTRLQQALQHHGLTGWFHRRMSASTTTYCMSEGSTLNLQRLASGFRVRQVLAFACADCADFAMVLQHNALRYLQAHCWSYHVQHLQQP